jgi:hypothetical protein
MIIAGTLIRRKIGRNYRRIEAVGGVIGVRGRILRSWIR